MIFVTVGTGKFDELIKEIDRVAPSLNEKVIAQIGKGEYKPKNIEYFDFKNPLTNYYKKASLVISHGGAGTIYELLSLNKKVIGIANINRTDEHQIEILNALSKQHFLMWCKNIGDLSGIIGCYKGIKIKKYEKPECKIAEKIKEYLEKCAG